MTRFALVAAVGSARRNLSIVIAALAIGGAGYVGTHGPPAIGPAWMSGYSLPPVNCFYLCRPTIVQPGPASRAGIPAAVLLGLAGLGLAVAVGGWRRPQRRISQARLPRAWR